MNIKHISSLILSAAVCMPAFAAELNGMSDDSNTIYSGADYIQSENITSKRFEYINSSSANNCDTQDRDYTTEVEIRSFSRSSDSFECIEFTITNLITDDTFIQSGYSYSDQTTEFNPGITVIPPSIEIGIEWSNTSTVTNNGIEQGTRTDTFVATATSDVSISESKYEFSECLIVNWNVQTSYQDTSSNYKLWFCPNFGLVKYEVASTDDMDKQIWELVSYQERQGNDEDNDQGNDEDNDQGNDDEVEPVTVSGADYIQTENIISKQFRDTLTADYECDIEARTFDGSEEIRIYKNSEDGEECNNMKFTKDITESTLSYSTYEMPDYYNYSVEYNPALPIIIEEMQINQSWGGPSNELWSHDYGSGTTPRTDTFTVTAIENISVPAGNFQQCLNILWNTTRELEDDTYNGIVTLWICPEIGLVKYTREDMNEGPYQSWELQSYEEVEVIEPITASGADYIQSNDISYKRFELLNANIDDCNVEERAFNGAEETRFISNSNKGTDCQELIYYKEITKSTLNYLGKTTVFKDLYSNETGEVIGKFSNDYTFNPGLPIIISEMTVGESWSQTYVSKGSYENDYFDDEKNEDTSGEFELDFTDTYTLESIEDITVPAGQFQQCININWTTAFTQSNSLYSTNRIWICPEVGLVKYDSTLVNQDTKSWELQEYTQTNTSGQTDGNGSGGSGGGGSLPLSITLLLGIIAIRRKTF